MCSKIVDVILAAAIVLVALGGPARGVEPAEYRAPEENRAATKAARAAELAYRWELVFLRAPVNRLPPGQARHQRYSRGNRFGQRRSPTFAQQYYTAAWAHHASRFGYQRPQPCCW